jgi:hypothetical protein
MTRSLGLMTVTGQSRHFGRRQTTSGLPLGTDIVRPTRPVREARAFAIEASRRHLVGRQTQKSPQPTMMSSQRGPTEDEDGRWTTRPDAIASSAARSRRDRSPDYTRSRVDFGYTCRGRCYSRRPSRRPETHPYCICIHRVAMMSRMRGQSGRSRESEDSKTDKNAFGHSQLL